MADDTEAPISEDQAEKKRAFEEARKAAREREAESNEEVGIVALHEETERELVDKAARLSTKLLYEVIRRDAEEEMARPGRSLWWSGIAAGVMISFSVMGEAIFRTYLPDTPWRYLVENLGYSFGFLFVILGGLQLFTENTLTTVLPVMSDPRPRMIYRIARLWSLVLCANVIGAFLIAALWSYVPVLPPEILPAIEELSRHATGMGALEGFSRAIPAGIIVAAIVWMLPQAEGSEFWVVLLFTWLIAAGDFTHIVAGSVEMAFLMVNGELGLIPAIFGFFLPVFAGNVMGGTVIFAMVVWGQVKDELIVVRRRDAEATRGSKRK